MCVCGTAELVCAAEAIDSVFADEVRASPALQSKFNCTVDARGAICEGESETERAQKGEL